MNRINTPLPLNTPEYLSTRNQLEDIVYNSSDKSIVSAVRSVFNIFETNGGLQMLTSEAYSGHVLLRDKIVKLIEVHESSLKDEEIATLRTIEQLFSRSVNVNAAVSRGTFYQILVDADFVKSVESDLFLTTELDNWLIEGDKSESAVLDKACHLLEKAPRVFYSYFDKFAALGVDSAKVLIMVEKTRVQTFAKNLDIFFSICTKAGIKRAKFTQIFEKVLIGFVSYFPVGIQMSDII